MQNGRYYAGMIKNLARRAQTSHLSAPISSSRSLGRHFFKQRAPLSDMLSMAFVNKIACREFSFMLLY
jgi:hypothetical protein